MANTNSNWLNRIIDKQARRRFVPGDKVRFFTLPHKGTGKGHVLTPVYARGTVQDFDSATRRYNIMTEMGEVVSMHPKNITYDSVVRN